MSVMPDAADLTPHLWLNAEFDCQSNDYLVLSSRLRSVAQLRGFCIEVLGQTAGEPILLLTRLAAMADAPRLLVASGFHGEEPAGPWGLLRALETLDSALLDSVHLAVLPLINITGFVRGTRLNHHNENPNRGYLDVGDGARPSEEGIVLLAHEATLGALGRDGVLTCHEDCLLAHAYVYANESLSSPGPMALALRDCNGGHFPLHPDGLVDGCVVKNGLVFNQRDSSFESWLLSVGSANTYCTETPGRADFSLRVAANSMLVATFLAGVTMVDLAKKGSPRRDVFSPTSFP